MKPITQSIHALAVSLTLAATPSAHSQAILTASKDTYINSAAASTNYGNDTVMVTNWNSTSFRYAIFSYDISTVNFTVGGAKLELRDDIGNAGTKQYQIFGLLDAHDGWIETGSEALMWNNSTGFRDSNAIDLTQVYGGAPLGTFNTAQNSLFTAFDVSSGAHLDFINANRSANGGNNIVTYIIADPLVSSQGTGWATKEHASQPAATLTLISSAPDTTPPTLAGSDMIDGVVGDSVAIGTMVTYTLTFSEPMNAATLTAEDFGNAGTAPVSFGNVTADAPGVFTVQVTPTSLGTLQLMVLAGAELEDLAGNPLDTTSAIVAEASIEVVESLPPPVLRNLRVFLIGGQSNADGRAATSGLPASPVNLQLPQDDVDLFYKVEGKSPTLTTLRPGLSETNGFGPEVTFGRRLSDALADGVTTRIALIKYANGGTNLHTHWKGGGNATTTGDGSEYLVFQQTVSGGLAALTAAYPSTTITLEGMLWVQGESDINQAANYQANLNTFIADIRATYGTDLWFVISRLSSGQTNLNATNLATIRAGQAAVADADPLNALLDTDGFGMSGDNLHFNATGYHEIGNGAAASLLNFMPFTSQPRISAQPGDNLQIQLADAFPGFLYSLNSSETLLKNSWQFEESLTASGTVIEFSVIPNPLAKRRFYRIERTLAP
jgi:hypothetical protein